MPGCHYQSRTERENDMDKTYEPIGNKPGEKIKVDSIDTIVTTHGDKPYYENKYREVGDKCYHIGYSSYRLDVALEYREKYFELVERENDWIPVSERLPKKPEIDGDSDDYIVQTRRVAQLKTDLVASGEKAVQDIQTAGSEQLGKMQAVAEAFTADREQVATNKEDIGSLKEDIGNKAPAIIKKASGKTIIINDSSNLPIKILSGTGKIIITGKNILNIKKRNEFIPFEAKAGTLFTLITNGELSEGGNVLFTGENDENVWFAIDKGKTRVSAKIGGNVKGYKNLLGTKEGLKYCFSVGENDEYEEYVEQVITTPVDSEQLKAIHTNYPTTVLTSENEISVEYVADTEAYIGKRIKEENQSLQKQILEIQSALISQKISGV